MSEKVLTSAYGLEAAAIFQEAIATENHYIFAGKSLPYANSDAIIEVPHTNEGYIDDVYKSMLFGKKIDVTDTSVIASRYDWSANTVFAQYDDQDELLPTKNFYTVVNAGSTYHVYKCLYNNNDSPSTVEPDFSAVTLTDRYYETSDGYIWKYLYSVDSANVAKFSTASYFPVGQNNTVVNNAVAGSIDIIKVIDEGNGYSNYIAGSNKFASDQLRLNGDGTLYNISSNATASIANDFYNGCYIYIKSGPTNEVGQYRKIVDYYTNSSSKTIVLDSAFTNAISIASYYDIYPGVVITGDGSETVNAVGRAIVNTSTNTIYQIEMLASGANYQFATANVFAHSIVGASPATIRPIFPPYNGHGYDPKNELYANSIMISVQFSNTESNTILGTNDYRTIGIIKQPLFANVSVEIASKSGTFVNGETVYKINPILLGSGGTLDGTNVYTNENIDLSKQFSVDDSILFYDGVSYFYTTVDSVTNSSSIILTSNSTLNSSNINHYIPNVNTSAKVYSSNSTFVVLNDVDNYILTDDLLFGTESGANFIANTIYISGVPKGFNTFINAYKYSTNIISGSFEEDELVYQISPDIANAYFHSVVNTDIFTTKNVGNIVSGKVLQGQDSGALADISVAYNPELKYRSGKILYIENVSPITRETTQSESFKLIFNY